jgi:hypothetical protein
MKLTRMSTWSAEASSRRISCSSDGEPLPAVNSQGSRETDLGRCRELPIALHGTQHAQRLRHQVDDFA